MPKLKQLPSWLIAADKDLIKYRPVSPPPLKTEEPIQQQEHENIPKKVEKEKYESDEDDYKPKTKTKKTKKKVTKVISESEGESDESEESDYEERIQKCKNLKRYFKRK
jgi:hypothetical protein